MNIQKFLSFYYFYCLDLYCETILYFTDLRNHGTVSFKKNLNNTMLFFVHTKTRRWGFAGQTLLSILIIWFKAWGMVEKNNKKTE
jgi:hypothetical protein